MKSVALLGFSNKTLPYVFNSKADEKWSLNHTYLIENFPKIDRHFELHNKKWFLRKESPKSKEYGEWLKQKHDFPSYMQHKYKIFPSSVKYPFVEVVKDCLPNLVQVNNEGIEKARQYFTSTLDYMIAMAIHEKFDQIEFYGVDMENDTEWGYQKPGGEFWLGMALGRGIKVIIPEPCLLCKAPLYGYEVVPYIDVSDLKYIIRTYQDRYDQIHEKCEEYRPIVEANPNDEEIGQRWMDLTGWLYLHEGAIMAGTKLIHESDSYISQQFVDLKTANWTNGLNYWLAMTNKTKTDFHASVQRGENDLKLFQDYVDARANLFANMGAEQLHRQLLDTMKMRPVEYKLKLSVLEYDGEEEPRKVMLL
jgi:hypothetical protein